MKRAIITLILLVLLSGCAVEPKRITLAEGKEIRKMFIERLYLEHLLRKAEIEFGVELDKVW